MNAVNIKSLVNACRSIKVVPVLSYTQLGENRNRNLLDLGRAVLSVFKNLDVALRNRGSVLLVVTKVP